MKSSLFVLVFLGLLTFTKTTAQSVSLVKKWETDTLLNVPEAVIYDETNKRIYVANIKGKPWEKDGNGFISKLTLEGKIEKLEWVVGLDAPKGLGIYKNKLYIADVTKVVIVDIAKGTIEKTIEIEGAQTLNDITIDASGKVYISDSAGKKVYVIENNTASVFAEVPEWKRPNGLLALKNELRLVDAETGTFYTVNYSTKTAQATAQGLTKGDGIVEIGKDEFLISNWSGEISYVKGDKVQKLLDTQAIKRNAADIWYVASQRIVLVPTFFGNTVAAYQLEHP